MFARGFIMLERTVCKALCCLNRMQWNGLSNLLNAMTNISSVNYS